MSEIRLSKLVSPTAKQTEFLEALKKFAYVLYGGAAGGGKSFILQWALVILALRAFALHGVRHVNVGLFCETYPALQQRHLSVWRVPKALGEIQETKKEGLRFKLREELGGGRVMLLNLDDPSKYDSVEFAAVGVDEWTKNPWHVFDELRKRLRWPMMAGTQHLPCGGRLANAAGVVVECPIKEHHTQPAWNFPFLMTSNPGGKGHAETKRIFIDKNFPSHLKTISHLFTFVQAKSADNPYNPPDYYDRNLATLPEKMRLAYAEGSWDTFEGQYYPNFDPQLRQASEGNLQALIQPWWPRWASMDWGYKHYFSCHWHTKGVVTPEQAKLWLGRPDWKRARTVVITYREMLRQGRADREVAADFLSNCDVIDRQQLKRIFLSPDAWQKRTAQNTIAEEIGGVLTNGGFPRPDKADDDRIGGWRLIHGLIDRDEWFISSVCPELLSAMPVLEHDDVKLEDVKKTDDISDDVADDVRYGLKSMLSPGKKPYAIELAETLAPIEDMHQKHMAHIAMESKHKRKSVGFSLSRRRR